MATLLPSILIALAIRLKGLFMPFASCLTRSLIGPLGFRLSLLKVSRFSRIVRLKMAKSDIDWKVCAEALNRKLNFIGNRLVAINHDTVSADVAFVTAQLVEDFGLDSSEHYPSVDYCELVRLDEQVGKLISSLRLAPFSSREAVLDKLQEVHSDFSMSLGIYGAFV